MVQLLCVSSLLQACISLYLLINVNAVTVRSKTQYLHKYPTNLIPDSPGLMSVTTVLGMDLLELCLCPQLLGPLPAAFCPQTCPKLLANKAFTMAQLKIPNHHLGAQILGVDHASLIGPI